MNGLPRQALSMVRDVLLLAVHRSVPGVTLFQTRDATARAFARPARHRADRRLLNFVAFIAAVRDRCRRQQRLGPKVMHAVVSPWRAIAMISIPAITDRALLFGRWWALSRLGEYWPNRRHAGGSVPPERVGVYMGSSTCSSSFR